MTHFWRGGRNTPSKYREQNGSKKNIRLDAQIHRPALANRSPAGASTGSGLPAAFFCSFALLAQNNTGELRLRVTDQSGAALAAKADLVSQASKTHQTVDLSAHGRYSFKNLPFGLYVITLTETGFAPSSELVEIRSVIPLTLAIKLAVNPVQTAVEVKDSDTLISPDRTAAAYFTSSQEIRERRMSQPGRGLIDLAVMQPDGPSRRMEVPHPRESEYDTQYIVNGFPVQDNRSPAFARPIEADDVESMKQYTSGIPAEFGNKLGGVIELNTTRNNSPGFHGVYIAQGGSFDTLSSYLSGQYSSRRQNGFGQRRGICNGSLPGSAYNG